MLRRKKADTLAEWKTTTDHKPLILKGCRQCENTFSVLQFARENYEHHPEKYHVEQCIKLGDYNVGRAGQILTLPLYMDFFLRSID